MPCHAIPRHTATLCNSCLKPIFSLLVEHVHHSVPLCRVPRVPRQSAVSPRHTAHDTLTHRIDFWQCCVDDTHTHDTLITWPCCCRCYSPPPPPPPTPPLPRLPLLPPLPLLPHKARAAGGSCLSTSVAAGVPRWSARRRCGRSDEWRNGGACASWDGTPRWQRRSRARARAPRLRPHPSTGAPRSPRSPRGANTRAQLCANCYRACALPSSTDARHALHVQCMRLTLANVTPMVLPSLLTSPHTTISLFPLPTIALSVTRWGGSGVVVVGKVHKCGTKLMHNFLLERVAKARGAGGEPLIVGNVRARARGRTAGRRWSVDAAPRARVAPARPLLTPPLAVSALRGVRALAARAQGVQTQESRQGAAVRGRLLGSASGE